MFGSRVFRECYPHASLSLRPTSIRQSISGSSKDVKLERYGFLGRFSCQIAHPESDTCPGEFFPHGRVASLVPVGLLLAHGSSESQDPKPSNEVLKAALNMMPKLLIHNVASKTDLPNLSSLVRLGLKHDDRSIRLATG